MRTKVTFFVIFASIFMLLFVSASADSLPQYYNSLESEYSDRLPRVRRQEYGDQKYLDCWSYAAIASVEFSGIFKDYWDFSSIDSIFSEHHMAACMNRTNDEKYIDYTRSRDTGGNREMATAYFSRGVASGPVLNRDFTEVTYKNYLVSKDDYSQLLDYKKQATLTKAHFLTQVYEGSSILIDGYKYNKNTQVINKIKEAVKEVGGVTASYYSYERKEDSKYYNRETCAYCVSWDDLLQGTTPDGNCVILENDGYTFKDASNHAITIVGWDDNYSYENFAATPYSYDGENYTPENGAWIVRNSWGESFGDGGYEYISYMDPCIGFLATVYEIEDLTDYNVLTYTPKGLMASVAFHNREYGEYTANRYYEQKGVLSCVGIYICNEKLSASVVIDNKPDENLKDFTNESYDDACALLIDSETGEYLTEIKEKNPGYYVYKLANPVAVDGDFDIYVRYTVPKTMKVSLAIGSEYGSDDPYTENVSYYASMTSYGSKQWKALNANWGVNAYVTKSSFEVPDVTITGEKVTAVFMRYNPSASGKIYLASYKNGRMTDCVSKIITSDFEILELELPKDVDAVRTFICQSEIEEPYKNYRKLTSVGYRRYNLN